MHSWSISFKIAVFYFHGFQLCMWHYVPVVSCMQHFFADVTVQYKKVPHAVSIERNPFPAKILLEKELMMPTLWAKCILCKTFSVWFLAGKGLLSIEIACGSSFILHCDIAKTCCIQLAPGLHKYSEKYSNNNPLVHCKQEYQMWFDMWKLCVKTEWKSMDAFINHGIKLSRVLSRMCYVSID